MFDISKHRHILFELINGIYRSHIGAFLGLKGGTMAYYFLGLDRFSIDLDFDLLDHSKKEIIIEELPFLLEEYGRIKEKADKKATILFVLNYENGGKNIKIEISKRMLKKEAYIFANFYGTDVLIMKPEFAFAEKLIACTQRNKIASRDFYDVYFYLKEGILPDKVSVEIGSEKDYRQYLQDLIIFTEKNLTDQNILHGLGELVNEKQKYWIKSNLKREILNRLAFLRDYS